MLVASFDLVVLCLVDVGDKDYFVAIFAYFVEGEFVVVLVLGIWDWQVVATLA